MNCFNYTTPKITVQVRLFMIVGIFDDTCMPLTFLTFCDKFLPMRKNKTTIKEQGKACNDTLRTIEDAMLAKYGCLLPQGEITVSIVMPWTKETALGYLKRHGKIVAWELDKSYEEGNNRRYLVTLDADEV